MTSAAVNHVAQHGRTPAWECEPLPLHAPLLHICARHAYFGEQAVTRFRFAPSPATQATLRRLDIVTRVSAEGLTLVCPERTRIALRAGAEPALELEFHAWATGTSFALVTAPEAPAADARLIFHSAQALREETGNWRLHAAQHADAALALYPDPGVFGMGLLSRWPIVRADLDSDPSLIEAVVDAGGRSLASCGGGG